MAENTIAADPHVRKHLEQITLHLDLVHSGILVAADALRYQQCERDVDVAAVLTHCLSERLSVQIERISELITELATYETDLGEQEAHDDAASCHH